MRDESTTSPAAEDVERLKSNDAAVARTAEQRCVALAESGDVKAAEALSQAYNDGLPHVRQDAIRAYRYTARAADLGSSFSRYWLAKLQRDSGDYSNAIVNARIASSNGESLATVLLAEMTLHGHGCPAAPLQALDMLAQAAEKSDSDAAMALAKHLLKGEVVPRDPTRAYEILSSHDESMAVVEFIHPENFATFLFLKASALREGAMVAGAPDWIVLLKRAAGLGHSGAKTALQSWTAGETRAAWDKEWDAISRFSAYGTKWHLFFVTGRLRDVTGRHASTVGQVGNMVTTTTTNWKEAVFQVDGGSRTVKFEKNADLTIDRNYHLVYCGVDGTNSGIPMLVVEQGTHRVEHATGKLKDNFPSEAGNKKWKLVVYLLFFVVAYLWFVTQVLAFVVTAGWLFLLVKFVISPTGTVQDALARAAGQLRTLE